MSQQTGARRMQRSSEDRWLGGVCGGLAEYYGGPAALWRAGLAVTALIGGLGVVAYLLIWLLVPQAGAPEGHRPGARPLDLGGLLGLISMAIGFLMVLQLLGLPVRVSVWAPVLLLATGTVVLWRQGDDVRTRAEASGVPAPSSTQAARSGAGAGLPDRGLVLRVLVGVGLVSVGIVGILLPRLDLITLVQALVATVAVLAGVTVIALPWIRALAERFQAERIAAARAEERASVAARVHDSVLQTLTLIQRRVDDPQEVSRLARAEERALRSWLYGPAGPSGMLASTLADMVAQTEADYDDRIELVTVGDAVVDDRVAGLVAATREAVRNAATHAPGSATTVYVEVTEGQVEVNVRDRGPGFDVDAIGVDRHGVRESIVGRMAGLGGSASLRSSAGEGTEVRLILPREAGDE